MVCSDAYCADKSGLDAEVQTTELVLSAAPAAAVTMDDARFEAASCKTWPTFKSKSSENNNLQAVQP
jgi:hypothetical protein